MPNRNVLAALVLLVLAASTTSVALGSSRAAENANASGNRALDRGKLDVALKKYQKALQRAKADGDRQYEAIAMYGLARANARLCMLEEAEKWFRESIATRESLPDEPIAYLTQNWIEYGRFLQAHDRHNDAAKFFALAMPRLEALGIEASDPIGYAEFLDDFGASLAAAGRSGEARPLYEKSEALRQQHPGRTAGFSPKPYPKQCEGAKAK
jgi:tetratricopeptide (TPR) repeat protein